MEEILLCDLLKGIGVSKSPLAKISKISTNSRETGKDSVFVAVRGDKFDGNDFAEQALDNGAAAAIVSRSLSDDYRDRQILVTNTKDALIAMAGNYRARFSPRTLAVTGSVGKTTTKEMTAAILEQFGETLKTRGNQNNEIGLPATLFEMNSKTKYAVLEMGMNGLGDIRKLTNAVRPQAAAITVIGVSHMELLGSRENILRAKLEIIEGMPKNGILAINGDDEMLLAARDSIPMETVTFAIDNSDSDIVAKDLMVRSLETEFTIEDKTNGTYEAKIPCAGRHNVMDALAAYAMTTRIGLDPQKCAQGLANYRPTGMRQRFAEHNGVTVIEDCYNASPDSMYASLDTLSKLPVSGLKIAVLGDMLELGSISQEAHKRLGIEMAALGIDILLCMGDEMLICAEAAKAAGLTSVEHFTDKRELSNYLKRTVHKGDVVMFKASRAMTFERIIEMFYED
ncbi:MAG: UDP-N-acetylmuramoyl-tripeptide--D-alanyl-D-alanine ligase [Oscillospiraceae bacterium]